MDLQMMLKWVERKVLSKSLYSNVLGGAVFIPNGRCDAVVLLISYFFDLLYLFLCFEAIGPALSCLSFWLSQNMLKTRYCGQQKHSF
jgi:hypothetical protein